MRKLTGHDFKVMATESGNIVYQAEVAAFFRYTTYM